MTEVRVLFSATPGYGHVQPMLPLAAAFMDAGDDVVVAVAPELTARLARAGFTTMPAGDDFADWWEQLRLRHPGEPWQRLEPEHILHWFVPHLFAEVGAPAMLGDLRAIVGVWRPDLIVHETFEFAAPVAAALAGVRAVHHTLSPLPGRDIFDLAAAAVAPLWRDSGLGQPPDAWPDSAACVDICPPSLRNPDGPWLARPRQLRPTQVKAAPGEALPTSVLRLPDQPTVHVTLGTSVTSADQGVIATIIDGLRDEPVNVVATVGPANDPAALGPQPANVCVERYLPHALLLPRCALVVSHGGAGTTLAALAHGLPLLTIPQGADQYLNADMCARRGVGRTLLASRLTPRSARCEVRRLLDDPGCRATARDVAAEIAAMPPPGDVAGLLRVELARR